MNRRHWMARGILTLLAVAALMLTTGCTDNADDTTPKTGKPAQSASDALARAAQRLQADSFKMALTMTVANGDTGNLSGIMDPTKKVGAFTSTFTHDGTPTTSEWRVIGRTVYLKTSASTAALPGSSRKGWQRINPGTDTMSDDFDGAQMASTLERATTVKRAGDNAFTGTIDVSLAADALGTSTLKPKVGSSSSTTQLVPFRADTDGQGRLTRYSLELPNPTGGVNKVTLTYSNFGTAVEVQAPPADQITTKAFR